MARVVACPAFTGHFIEPLADQLWGLGHPCDVVQYPKAAGSYLDSCEAAILARIKATRLEPPTLLGYSLGGYLAACVAAKHPDKVAGLILVAAPGSLKTALSRIATERKLRPAQALRAIFPSSDVDIDKLVTELRRLPLAAEAEALATQIRAPTLCIYASNDNVAVAAEPTLHAGIPHSVLHVVEDDHFLRASVSPIADRVHAFLVAAATARHVAS